MTLRTLSEYLGDRVTSTQFDNDSDSSERYKLFKAAEHVEFSKDTIPDILCKIEGADEASKVTVEDFTSFEKKIHGSVKLCFEGLAPLTEITAYLWLQKLSEFLDEYENFRYILTTLDYEDADFEGRKLSWSYFTFWGNFEIQNAVKIIDDALRMYFTKDYVSPKLFYGRRFNTRDLWWKVDTMADPRNPAPITLLRKS